LRAVRLFLV